ncbi:ubiquitin-conjugating enzyme E2 T-like [Antedon mediterranea]|uniref:ubiquitin-conjugating enzyme E2 T-like n=1 Tax=Antedon mediterranea TaxID=105859 RepID=UPI003AF5E847
MQRLGRMKKELKMFETSPPSGITCSMKSDDSSDSLEAQILGAEKTPYDGGIFKLDIELPVRYPFEPPKVRFVTPIYHPNIDSAGRICLDILKMPPNGNWRPSLNLLTLLTSIQLLMSDPNPEDPLMHDISKEFKYNNVQFKKTAVEWTKKHALTTDLLTICNKTQQTSSNSDETNLSKEKNEDIENNKTEKRKKGLTSCDNSAKKIKCNDNI